MLSFYFLNRLRLPPLLWQPAFGISLLHKPGKPGDKPLPLSVLAQNQLQATLPPARPFLVSRIAKLLSLFEVLPWSWWWLALRGLHCFHNHLLLPPAEEVDQRSFLKSSRGLCTKVFSHPLAQISELRSAGLLRWPHLYVTKVCDVASVPNSPVQCSED